MPDSTPSDERLIDDWLPAYAVRDVATRVVHGEPGTVFEAAKQLDLLGDPLIRSLFAVRQVPGKVIDWYRGMAPEAESADEFTVKSLTESEGGFVLLEEAPDRELVLGAAGRFWSPRAQFRAITAEEFRTYAVTGDARAALSLRVAPASGAGQSRVSFEVRVAPIGRGAGWSFRAYWTLIGRFSHMIRVRALERLARELRQ